MNQRSSSSSHPEVVTIGTAGHIDHGKTALVHALTGIQTDRLREEQERGITIDLGFAHLGGDAGEPTLGFVDVPGHERFVKNMLAGAGGIDVVLLVVAADESVMPQTVEHFRICELLGIRDGIVAVTKSDLVDEEMRDLVRLELEEFTSGTFLQNCPVLPVSSVTGDGIDALKSELFQTARRIRSRDAGGVARLPTDRAFTVRGFGTVVTGTLVTGTVTVEDSVEIQPSGKRCRVRNIQVFGRECRSASAGARTALNLDGVDIANVPRGTTVTEPGLFKPTHRVDCMIRLLGEADRSLRHMARVHFHQSSSEALSRVALLDRLKLEPGDSAPAQMLLEEPAFLLPGDRFIFRSYSPMMTIGGGIVTHTVVPRYRGKKKEAAVERIRNWNDLSTGERCLDLIREQGEMGLTLPELVSRTGLRKEILTEALRNHAIDVSQIGNSPPRFLHETAQADLERRAISLIDEYHRAKPLEPGIPREELLERLGNRIAQATGKHILLRLTELGSIREQGPIVALCSHRVRFSEDQNRLSDDLEDRILKGALTPPSLQELSESLSTDKAELRRILRVLVNQEKLVKINEDFHIHSQAKDKLLEEIRRLGEGGKAIAVSHVKTATGATRKHVIPLLEYLDRTRVTVRKGNERLLREPSH